MNIKRPRELESYNDWQQAKQQRKAIEKDIKDCRNAVKDVRNKLPKLEKEARRITRKDDSNLEEINAADEAVAQAQKEITNQKEQWQQLDEALEEQRLAEEQAKLSFLKEAAEHAEKIVDEFVPMIHKAKELKDAIYAYDQFDLHLPGIDNEALIYWTSKDPEDLLQGFRQRVEALKNDEYIHHDLKQLQSNNN